MTTSISSEAQKNRPLSKLGAEKITFPPKPGGQSDSQTDGRTLVFIEKLRFQKKTQCMVQSTWSNYALLARKMRSYLIPD